jgi:hypothetical protein
MTPPSKVKFTQDYLVRTPRERAFYPIPESDWERLKRMIRSVVPARRLFQNLGSAAAGIFGSAVLALVAVYSTPNLPAWVKPTTLAIGATSFILGIAFYVLDSVQRHIIQSSTDDVIREMETIEKNYSEDEVDLGQLTTHQFGPLLRTVQTSALNRAKTALQEKSIPESLRPGRRVRHPQFGIGIIRNIERSMGSQHLRVDFGRPNGERLIPMTEPGLTPLDGIDF